MDYVVPTWSLLSVDLLLKQMGPLRTLMVDPKSSPKVQVLHSWRYL